MKKVFVVLSLMLFVGSVSASVFSVANGDTIEITHQDHKKKKQECKKGSEKTCCSDKKKEECKKGDEKKKCCASKEKK